MTLFNLIQKAKKIVQYVKQDGFTRNCTYFSINIPDCNPLLVTIETDKDGTRLKNCDCKWHSGYRNQTKLGTLCQYYLACLYFLEKKG